MKTTKVREKPRGLNKILRHVKNMKAYKKSESTYKVM